MFMRIYNAFTGGFSLQDTKGFWGKIHRLKSERRERRFFYQRLEDGFSDDDLWNLDSTIAKFVLPRLKRFREIEAGHPGCFEDPKDWYVILDKMIFAMEKIATDEHCFPPKHESDKIQEGCKLFGKWFLSLWD